MADTTYTTNNASTVKLWSRKLYREVKAETWAEKFIGMDSNSMIMISPDLSKSAGDKCTATLRMQLSGAGTTGDDTLEGNEEALTTYTDAVVIDQLRHAVRNKGRMSDQRVAFSVRSESVMGLADWWATRIDVSMMNQLAGNTAVTDVEYTGMMATSAPTATHHVFAGTATAETGLGTTDTFTLSILDKCVERAKTLSPIIRPLRINGKKMYVAFLHPYQVTDLRTNTNTGQWLDIQKAAMMGGKTTDNPIFDGSLGVYNNVILHESSHVPSVQANTRRAIFCGAQAGIIAYGRNDQAAAIGVRKRQENRMTWVEEQFDYGNKLGVSAGMIWALKKAKFNSADFATIVMSTYAVAH